MKKANQVCFTCKQPGRLVLKHTKSPPNDNDWGKPKLPSRAFYHQHCYRMERHWQAENIQVAFFVTKEETNPMKAEFLTRIGRPVVEWTRIR